MYIILIKASKYGCKVTVKWEDYKKNSTKKPFILWYLEKYE